MGKDYRKHSSYRSTANHPDDDKTKEKKIAKDEITLFTNPQAVAK